MYNVERISSDKHSHGFTVSGYGWEIHIYQQTGNEWLARFQVGPLCTYVGAKTFDECFCAVADAILTFNAVRDANESSPCDAPSTTPNSNAKGAKV